VSETSYNVQIWNTEGRKNAAGKITSYRVRWRVENQDHRQAFKTSAHAESFRSELLTAARKCPGPRWWSTGYESAGWLIHWFRKAAGVSPPSDPWGRAMLYSILQSSANTCASSRVSNCSVDKNSSRNRPLNDSL